MFKKKKLLFEKFMESLRSVLPITLIIIFICFTFVPISTDAMLSFLLGSAMLVVGIALFTIGVENAMIPIGEHSGTWMAKTQKFRIIIPLSFVLGAVIAIAEPNLQVLAANVPFMNKTVLTLSMAAGVGIMLTVGILRIFYRIKLKWFLLFFYTAIFVFTAFVESDFLGAAFDAGGIITGPVTVPFIMALCVGAASLRSDTGADADSFGLVSFIAAGPIFVVMALSFVYKGNAVVTLDTLKLYSDTLELSGSFVRAIPVYMLEVLSALAPIFICFLLFQFAVLKLNRNTFIRITTGVLFTYVGLVLFLTGVNVSFSPVGSLIGGVLAENDMLVLLVLVGTALGWFSISAEPSVQVLNKQVEEISGGTITAGAMGTALSIAVACAMAFSMIRVISGISILWILVPGYLVSLALMFFVPDIFTSIAFDSGGVASGPMSVTFMLPFAIGASRALGGNILSDAFGLVGTVAMMPLITIQVMGAIYKIKLKVAKEQAAVYGDTEVIDLWEV